MSVLVEVTMECGHSTQFRYGPPKRGERIYCTRCDDMRKVVGGPGDYRAVCDHCTLLYLTRRSPDPIRRNVLKHLQRYPEHVVTVWRIGNDEAIKVRLSDHLPSLLDGFDCPDTLPYAN